jgi:hypothetical protein
VRAETEPRSGQYCSQARIVARSVLAGAGDLAAGRHQHAGTEDGENSQGEAQSPQPKGISFSCDPFIETKKLKFTYDASVSLFYRNQIANIFGKYLYGVSLALASGLTRAFDTHD